jgi:hypothetical protein
VWVWVWDWLHSHTPPRTRSPSSRHPPFTHYPFPLRSLVCGGQPSPHKPRLVVSHSTCPPLSSSPHAHSFVLGSAVINTHPRMTKTSFDTLTGKATQPYDDGRVQPGDDIPTIKELRPFLGYFNAMHSAASNNRYRDHRGHTHHVKGTTGGQQGDGLEMMRYTFSAPHHGSRVRPPIVMLAGSVLTTI